MSAIALARRPAASFCTIGETVTKATTPTTAAIAARARTRLSSLATWRPFTLDWAEVARPAAKHYGALTKALTLNATASPEPSRPTPAICRGISLPRSNELTAPSIPVPQPGHFSSTGALQGQFLHAQRKKAGARCDPPRPFLRWFRGSALLFGPGGGALGGSLVGPPCSRPRAAFRGPPGSRAWRPWRARRWRRTSARRRRRRRAAAHVPPRLQSVGPHSGAALCANAVTGTKASASAMPKVLRCMGEFSRILVDVSADPVLGSGSVEPDA